MAGAQDSAVAKLIQRFDNLPVTTRQALPASLRFTYHKEQFGELSFRRSTAVVPTRTASEGEEYNDARFPSALAHDDSARGCKRSCEPGLCADSAHSAHRRNCGEHAVDGSRPERRDQPGRSAADGRRDGPADADPERKGPGGTVGQ